MGRGISYGRHNGGVGEICERLPPIAAGTRIRVILCHEECTQSTTPRRSVYFFGVSRAKAGVRRPTVTVIHGETRQQQLEGEMYDALGAPKVTQMPQEEINLGTYLAKHHG
jgi:hypothetical protein